MASNKQGKPGKIGNSRLSIFEKPKPSQPATRSTEKPRKRAHSLAAKFEHIAQAQPVQESRRSSEPAKPITIPRAQTQPQTATISYRYNGRSYSVQPQSQKYTIADLRKHVAANTGEPAHVLTFKLESELVSDFTMDIMAYFQKWQKNEISFDVERVQPSKQHVESRKSVFEFIKQSQGDAMSNVLSELRGQFKQAYFTQSEGKEASISANDDHGAWDQNLKASIGSAITTQQDRAFDEIVEKFEQRIKGKLDEHSSLHEKVKANAQHIEVQQELARLMDAKKATLEKLYNERLQAMKEHHTTSNILWDTTQSERLQKSGSSEQIKAEIAAYRAKRKAYQQRQIANLQTEYERQQQVISKLEQKQTDKLGENKDPKEWHQEFKAEEIHREKTDTLKEMIRHKIEATHSQIKYAKYLHNSPFAKDLKQRAQEFDREITRIAALADEPLVIDAVARDTEFDDDDVCSDDDEKSPHEDDGDRYLEFELRFNDDYATFDETKKAEIQKSFANLIGIAPEQLVFVSSRAGSIISKFKAKLKAVHEKVKEVGRGMVIGFAGSDDRRDSCTGCACAMCSNLAASECALFRGFSVDLVAGWLGFGFSNMDKRELPILPGFPCLLDAIA